MTNPLNGQFLIQNCDFTLSNCNFKGVEGQQCASQFCNGFPSTEGTCPQIGLDPQNCCGSSDAASCLYTFAHGSGASSTNVCASVVSIIADCSSASPTLFPSGTIFTSGPGATALAGCMCYNNGQYDPDTLDNFAAECVSSGSAVHPTYYPYASRLLGFCTNIAGGGPASATAAPTATPSLTAATSMPPNTAVAPGTSSGKQAPVTGSTASSSARVTSPAGSSGSVTSGSAASSATVVSGSAASTSSKSSGGSVMNTFHASGILLLGLSMLSMLY